MRNTHDFRRARLLARAMALSLVLALALSGCTMLMPTGKPISAEGSTTKDGIVLEVERATISLPAGAVAAGTAVSIAMDDAGTPPAASSPPSDAPAPDAKDPAATLPDGQASGAALLVPASGRLAVTVGQDLAEGSAMTVTMALSALQDVPGFTTDAASLALAHLRSGDSTPELVRVAWTPERRIISAKVPAGGTFWAVHADIPALLGTAAQAVAATAPASGTKPECLDKPASASGMTFKAATAEGTWTCLREHNGMLVVAVAANSAVPMRLAGKERQAGIPVLEAKVLPPYFHQVLTPLLEQHKHLAAAMPGAALEYETAAAGVEHQDWELRPYPAMFLLNHLAAMVQATLDAGTDPATVDARGTAQCVAPLLEGSKEELVLEESWAVQFVQGFMECLAGSLQISPRMDVLLGAVNAVPALVAGSAVKHWDGLAVGEGGTLAITGELEWATYSGTLNDAKISFEHPVAWTVMDGSVNQQFAQPNSVLVYDHQGNKKAHLQVIDVFGISGPVDVTPVQDLGGVPGRAALSTGKAFETEVVAMDLTGKPAERVKHRWTNNVSLAMGLAIPTDVRALERLPNMMVGMVQVETGVQHHLTRQTTRLVSFGQILEFDSLEQAREFAKGGEFAAIQKMLASFRG